MGRGKAIEKVLSQMPEPSETCVVVCVTGTPGGNLLQVADSSGRTFLCRVPSKFRGKVWVIKGGYLLVDLMQQGDDDDGGGLGKVQGTLAHHLYRDQIRNLKSRGMWPSAFDAEPATSASASAVLPPQKPAPSDEYGVFDEYGDLPVNDNRRGLSESDDESVDEEEEADDPAADGDEHEDYGSSSPVPVAAAPAVRADSVAGGGVL